MKSIKQIFEANAYKEVELARVSISDVDWTQNMNSIIDLDFNKIMDIENILKDRLYQSCKNFYDANPNKRVADSSANVHIKIDFKDIDNDPSVVKLYHTLESFGASYWWFCVSTIGKCGMPRGIGYFDSSVKLTSKKMLDDVSSIKFKYLSILKRFRYYLL